MSTYCQYRREEEEVNLGSGPMEAFQMIPQLPHLHSVVLDPAHLRNIINHLLCFDM